ncbi:MAG: Holliday junction branch migration protein RuvA [Treponema sp.]|nr:Holliday junction branch migration protein RuvA [Treponema sp.]
MFNSLNGTITGKYPQRLTLETNGIEWDLTVPDSALDKIPAVGQTGRVYTWLQHSDVAMVLFGFASEADRALFFDLIKVDGIGPKGALKIMSNIASPDLARILDSGDLDSLQKVPGVGKKTAAKMLLQLKGKLTLQDEPLSGGRSKTVPYADVVSALVSMGYDRKIAEQAVQAVAKKVSQDPSFEKQAQANKEDLVFRQSLMELAQ